MPLPSDGTPFSLAETSFVASANRIITCSSEGRGWLEMAGVLCDSPTADDENVYRAVSSLTIACSLIDVELDVAVGDRLDRALIAGGSVSILAPGMSLAARTFTASRTCHAYIRPEVISEVADEIYGRSIDHIDIVSAVGLPGTTLAHLMFAFNDMLAEPDAHTFRGEYMARAIAAQVLTRHAQLIGTPPRADSVVPLSRAQLRQVRDFMEGHLHGDFQFAAIAAAIGLSRSTFFTRFMATMRCTPNQYLQTLRLARARTLLEDRRLSITEIAIASGFSDQSHMGRFFKRHLGMSPGRYRRTRL